MNKTRKILIYIVSLILFLTLSGPVFAQDSDGDGYEDSVDNCPDTWQPTQLDGDGDGIGNWCDSCPHDANNDEDGDGICGDTDNCPETWNSFQADTDSDGIGDVCDTCPNDAGNDADGDGVCGDVDNCPEIANPGQEDADNNGIGDVCDNPEDNSTTVEVLALEDYALSVYDFSGNYEESLDNDSSLKYTLMQDSKGKLTGSGEYSDADNNTIPVEVKGKVNGKVKKEVNIVSVQYKVKGKNEAGDKVQDQLKLELAEDNETMLTLDGSSKGKICVKGEKCEKFEDEAVSLPVPAGMTGEAIVEIKTSLDDKGKKLLGDAALILSNDDKYPLVAKGKINEKKGETKYQIKGDNKTTTNGIKLKIALDEADNATQINGKAFGQNLKYKKE